MKEIILGREIWPDCDGPGELNKWLERFGIYAVFLLDSGIKLEYPGNYEIYQVSHNSCYFLEAGTRAEILHAYEDFDQFVFESGTDKYVIPIYEEETFG